MLSVTLYGMEYTLGNLGQLSQCPFWTSLLPPAYSLSREGGAEREAKKALMLCKHSLAIARIPVCYQYYFSHRSKP